MCWLTARRLLKNVDEFFQTLIDFHHMLLFCVEYHSGSAVCHPNAPLNESEKSTVRWGDFRSHSRDLCEKRIQKLEINSAIEQ